MIYKYYEENLFNSHLHLLINCSKEEVEKFFQRKLKDKTFEIKIDKSFEGCYFSLVKGESFKRVIWLEHFDWSVRSQALLVHEITHLVMAVFQDVDIPISKENEESFAYFMAYWVKTIFWSIRVLNPIYKKNKKVWKRTSKNKK